MSLSEKPILLPKQAGSNVTCSREQLVASEELQRQHHSTRAPACFWNQSSATLMQGRS